MLNRLLPDKFIIILLGTIGVATLFPARGWGLQLASTISNGSIFSLFFFHGLRLERSSVWEGLKNWRLQLAALAVSYVMMPLMGLALSKLLPGLLPSAMLVGVLFLCSLPSTVQSAIAYSSIAGGNVAGSVVAAAASNLSAVILTPLIFAGLAHVGGFHSDLSAIGRIASLLLLPFALGQVARRWLANWAQRRKQWISKLDRLSIVITVYSAFSATVIDGLWSPLGSTEILQLLILVTALLTLAFTGAWLIGRALGLPRVDRVTLLFSGAHKSLATGAPMARILFPAATAGVIVIPLMLYHQLQLMISAWIASRLSDQSADLE